MDPAYRQLAALLPDVRLDPPRLPFVSSVTGDLVTDIDAYRDHLVGQVISPVRWYHAARRLGDLGAAEFVEVGPGRVLAGLGREVLRDRRHVGAVEAIRTAARDRAPAATGERGR
jgi:[acyl-carrier-protein] S-malonyltransferase